MTRKYGDLFSGLGGATIGAQNHGYTPVWGIEKDERLTRTAESNFRHDIITSDILSVDPRKLESVDVLHASPPCVNFSSARGCRAELKEIDLAFAGKIAEFVHVMNPYIVTIENVPMYCRSQACIELLKMLNEEGYATKIYNLNASLFGVPQSRNRTIIFAGRDGAGHDLNRVYEYLPVSWHTAIEDLVPYLQPSNFAPWQLDAFKKKGFDINTVGCQYIVDGQNSRGRVSLPTIRKAHEPSFTIVASVHKAPIRVWLRYKDIRQLNVRALARIQTFPDWYSFSGQRKIDLIGIGNAVPPILYERFLEGVYY